MTEAMKTLAQLKKASKLTRLAFHKNGPKSFKRGQGALLKFLLEDDGATQRDLVKKLGALTDELAEKTIALEDILDKAPEGEKEAMLFFHDSVLPAMAEVRDRADKLEVLTDKKAWPFPTYSELLFSER